MNKRVKTVGEVNNCGSIYMRIHEHFVRRIKTETDINI